VRKTAVVLADLFTLPLCRLPLSIPAADARVLRGVLLVVVAMLPAPAASLFIV